MYFALMLNEVSPSPYPCLEGLVLVFILVLEGQVLVLGGSVLVNITGENPIKNPIRSGDTGGCRVCAPPPPALTQPKNGPLFEG